MCFLSLLWSMLSTMESYSLSTTVSHKHIFNHVLCLQMLVTMVIKTNELYRHNIIFNLYSTKWWQPNTTRHTWCCMVSYCGFKIIYLSDHKLDMAASWLCLCLVQIMINCLQLCTSYQSFCAPVCGNAQHTAKQ